MTLIVRLGSKSPLFGKHIAEIRDEVANILWLNSLRVEDIKVRVEAFPEERDEEGPMRYVNVTKKYLADGKDGKEKVVTNDNRLRIKVIYSSAEDMEKAKMVCTWARQKYNWRVYCKTNTSILDYCRCSFEKQLVPSMLCRIRPNLFHKYIPKGEAANIKVLVWWDSLGKSVHQTFLCVRFICEYPIFKGRKYATPMDCYLATWQDDKNCAVHVARLAKEIIDCGETRYTCYQLFGREVGINCTEVHYTADRKAFARFMGIPHIRLSFLSCLLHYACCVCVPVVFTSSVLTSIAI